MKFKDNLVFIAQFVRATGLRYCVYKYLGAKKRFFRDVPDKEYIEKLYRLFYDRELNLDNPQSLTEKLQWLKLYDRNPIYTTATDKYEVKKLVADRLGDGAGKHIIPCIAGPWERAGDIDFESLPGRFVIKATHDSGGLVIVRDKSRCNYDKIRNFMANRLRRNFFWAGRGWNYKNVKPRVIVEPYVESLGNKDSVEYKITCFNGRVQFVTVCKGIAHDRLDSRTNDFYDRDFNKLNMVTSYYRNSTQENDKPKCYGEMIAAAEKLSEGIPYVRVDFYVDNNDYLFGEMTFTTWDGFIKFVPENVDYELGQELVLPIKKQ